AEGPVGPGDIAGVFELFGPVTLGQAQQALEDADAFHTTRLEHCLGPARAVRAEQSYFLQQPRGAAFDAGDLLVDDVARLRAEPPRFVPDVQSNLFEPLIEDPHRLTVP